MTHLRNGLLATVIVGLGFVGTAQAHDRDRGDGWRDVEVHYGQKAHKHRARSHGDGRYQRYVDRRQVRQQRRIDEGWRSGELTRKELKRLRKNQRRINHLERKFAADGYYSRHERKAMRKALDKASARIYGKKHNDRYRVTRYRDRGTGSRAEVFGLWSDDVGFVWYDLES